MARILFAPEPESETSTLRRRRTGAIAVSPQDFEKLLKGEIKIASGELHENFKFQQITCEMDIQPGKGIFPKDVMIYGRSETMFPRSYEAEAVPIISVEFVDADSEDVGVR